MNTEKKENSSYKRNILVETTKPLNNKYDDIESKKIIYQIALYDDKLYINRGAKTSDSTINFDIDKKSSNFKCNYKDIQNITIEHTLTKTFYIPIALSILLSIVQGLMFLPITLICFYLAYYKSLNIILNEKECFRILFQNNNLLQINFINYFLNKKSPNLNTNKHKIYGSSKDIYKVYLIIIIVCIFLNILLEIILSGSTHLNILHIIFRTWDYF